LARSRDRVFWGAAGRGQVKLEVERRTPPVDAKLGKHHTASTGNTVEIWKLMQCSHIDPEA